MTEHYDPNFLENDPWAQPSTPADASSGRSNLAASDCHAAMGRP
jgi:hypothetical protein